MASHHSTPKAPSPSRNFIQESRKLSTSSCLFWSLPLKCTTNSNSSTRFLVRVFKIDCRERRKGGGGRDIDLLFHLYMHSWLILVCALTGDRTCSLGVSGCYSNQLSYLAGPIHLVFLMCAVDTHLHYMGRASCSLHSGFMLLLLWLRHLHASLRP